MGLVDLDSLHRLEQGNCRDSGSLHKLELVSRQVLGSQHKFSQDLVSQHKLDLHNSQDLHSLHNLALSRHLDLFWVLLDNHASWGEALVDLLVPPLLGLLLLDLPVILDLLVLQQVGASLQLLHLLVEGLPPLQLVEGLLLWPPKAVVLLLQLHLLVVLEVQPRVVVLEVQPKEVA